MNFDPLYLLMFPVFLLSITIHEFSHAYSAYLGGDDTASLMGRMSFDPRAHIDIFGTIILPILAVLTNIPAFGWAKPVPVNPLKFRKRYWDIIVSAAGPASNLLLAIIAAGLIKVGILMNINNGLPLEMLLDRRQETPTQVYFFILLFFIQINVLLFIFNLIPIPPLDGSHILFYNLRRDTTKEKVYMFLYQFGFIILFFILFVVDFTQKAFVTIVTFFTLSVLKIFGLA